MSPMVHWLAENLGAVNISILDNPPFFWTVREEVFRQRNTGWMARLVNLPVLTQAMLPEWQARWHRSLAHWSGDLSLIVANEAFTLRIAGTHLQLLDMPDPSINALSLTPQAFTQAVFGYVPITRAFQYCDHSLSDDLTKVLTILFPIGQTWIPTSDWF